MLQLIVNGLATWRISNMLVNEYGPYGIFRALRIKTGVVYADNDEAITWPTWNPIHCLWCCSIYVACGVMVLPNSIKYVLSLSAIACLINSIQEGLDGKG